MSVVNQNCLRGSVCRTKLKGATEEGSTTVQTRKIYLMQCPSETFLPLLLIPKHSTHQVLIQCLWLEN